MLEQLAGLVKPEQLIKMLERFIPPSGRAIITLLPNLMKSRYDVTKHEMPTLSIKAKPETKQVMIIHTFTNLQDMELFLKSETEALVMVNKLADIAREQNAAK